MCLDPLVLLLQLLAAASGGGGDAAPPPRPPLVASPKATPLPLPSDHGDTPLLMQLGRHDANITDLHAFVDGGDLVLIVSMNPAIPPGLTTYTFPSDLTVLVNIDHSTEVRFDDAQAVRLYGGSIPRPEKIREDVVFAIGFGKNGPHLQTHGLRGNAKQSVRLWTGLRDDPFIRGPRIGRNVAAIVLSVPLQQVLHKQSTLMIWARAHVPGVKVPCMDHAGRSLRSMMPENDLLNYAEPRSQGSLTAHPDVMIYDTSRPAAYPNGRALGDDVVDLVGDARVLANDAPFPATNDVPFLTAFPWLAPPHP